MFERIDKQTAIQKLETDGILIDIRDAESFVNGHIENAIHITQQNMGDFIVNTSKDVPILVMCYHGNSSQSVAYYLSMQGFTEVYSIDGGYEGWIE
ncbi:MAG: thiosulfate sulfurtransferase GlpE [Dysgonomonas sp.]|nr:thiosulfate sulfurtransferase GlpE [Dysgonomonas sp.]